MIVMREMIREDIPSGLLLCRHAGWNQLSRDWDIFLQTTPHGCRVAVDESGHVVGTFTTVVYDDRFAWLGMVLVHPLFRRQGVGTRLLVEALSLLGESITVKLDATPAGRDVYLKLNFVDEYRIVRMHRAAKFYKLMQTTYVRPMTEEDLPYVLQFDRAVFGADRSGVLHRNFKDAPEYAFVVEKSGERTGFCMGRRGHNSDQIGPIIGQQHEDARLLLSEVLMRFENKPFIVDALQHTPQWISLLSEIGFVETRSLTRMYRGTNFFPGIPEKQFCILGPEFG